MMTRLEIRKGFIKEMSEEKEGQFKHHSLPN